MGTSRHVLYGGAGKIKRALPAKAGIGAHHLMREDSAFEQRLDLGLGEPLGFLGNR